MNRKTIIVSTIFSAITALVTALAVCAAFFFYKSPAQMSEAPPPVIEKQPTPPARKNEPAPVPQAEIKESDVNSVAIETVYKNFFAEGSECRKTYNEYYKNTDGVGSSSSPCNVKITFNADGSAEKTIEVKRYDRDARYWFILETRVWKGKIRDEQFKDLANLIVNNEAFKNWNDLVMINVSNCKIIVRHRNGAKSPMSNIDERATAYLPMVNAFKDLDARVEWEKAK